MGGECECECECLCLCLCACVCACMRVCVCVRSVSNPSSAGARCIHGCICLKLGVLVGVLYRAPVSLFYSVPPISFFLPSHVHLTLVSSPALRLAAHADWPLSVRLPRHFSPALCWAGPLTRQPSHYVCAAHGCRCCGFRGAFAIMSDRIRGASQGPLGISRSFHASILTK